VSKSYRGCKNVHGTDIVTPKNPSKKIIAYHRKKQRKRNGRWAAIEPVIKRFKSDYWMARCFLKGVEGARVNLVLAAAAWYFKKWTRKIIFVFIFELKRRNHVRNMFDQPKLL